MVIGEPAPVMMLRMVWLTPICGQLPQPRHLLPHHVHRSHLRRGDELKQTQAAAAPGLQQLLLCSSDRTARGITRDLGCTHTKSSRNCGQWCGFPTHPRAPGS